MKIIATDLDRTLLPNGKEEYDGTLNVFKNLVKKNNFILVYITGRSFNLVKKAIKKYKIPYPNYLITNVGTKVFEIKKNNSTNLKSWERSIKQQSPLWNTKKIKNSLKKLNEIKLQEQFKQDNFKISYYLDEKYLKNPEKILNKIRKQISSYSARVIFSMDFPEVRGLIDIVPKNASKKEALEFVIKKTKIKNKDVVFCGDSGNDFSILTTKFNSIIVKNAPPNLKKKVKKIKKKHLYLAKKQRYLNGNYVSGLIQGLIYFKFITKEQVIQEIKNSKATQLP